MKVKTASKVWENCLTFIKDNIDDSAYETWFLPIKSKKLVEQTLTIEVPSKFFHEWLENHYLEIIKVAINRELGENAKLIYSVRMENALDGKKPFSQVIPSLNKSVHKFNNTLVKEAPKDLKNPFVIPGVNSIKIESQLNPNYNFETFIEGDCNRMARSVGLEIAKRPGTSAFNPFFIFGNVGLGKTHLAHAIGVDIKEKYPEKTVLYISAEKFIQQYGVAAVNNTRNDFIHFYQLIDILIIDDVQFFSGKEKTQDVFFQIFNHLNQNFKQVIMTSDKAPVDMQDIEDRLLSRFKWGLSAKLQMPNEEIRIKILKSKLYRDGMEMPDEVIDYIAKNIKSGVRELEGILMSLIAQSTFNRKKVTIDLAKLITKNYVKNTKKEISIDYIQQVVTDYFKIDMDLLQSKTRKRDVVQARQSAMYFSKKLTKSSLAHIGSQIGKRDHATVLHACKTIENLMSTDKQFKASIEEISNKLSH